VHFMMATPELNEFKLSHYHIVYASGLTSFHERSDVFCRFVRARSNRLIRLPKNY